MTDYVLPRDRGKVPHELRSGDTGNVIVDAVRKRHLCKTERPHFWNGRTFIRESFESLTNNVPNHSPSAPMMLVMLASEPLHLPTI
jgi:hypothetical protein